MQEPSLSVDIMGFVEETGLDGDMPEELYHVFYDELSKERERTAQFYAEKKYLELTGTVHNIKGISASYKAPLVFEQAEQVDADCKAGRYQALASGLESLYLRIDEALAEIRIYYGWEA